MKEDIKLLKQEFLNIKKMGLIKTLRDGPTGVGYTFETLINKAEDQESKPDFNSIELKSKLGYSKSALTLFNCVPLKNNISAVKYIFDKYAHYRYGDKNSYKMFERKVFSNYTIKRFNIEFKLKVDYYASEIVLKSYENGVFVEDVCSWDFKVLEKRLHAKLKCLAVIEAYPYRMDNETYYKYVKLKFYKLKGFFEFLQLIEKDKIFVSFYMKEAISSKGNFIIKDHGVAFRINYNDIDKLFYKIK